MVRLKAMKRYLSHEMPVSCHLITIGSYFGSSLQSRHLCNVTLQSAYISSIKGGDWPLSVINYGQFCHHFCTKYIYLYKYICIHQLKNLSSRVCICKIILWCIKSRCRSSTVFTHSKSDSVCIQQNTATSMLSGHQ